MKKQPTTKSLKISEALHSDLRVHVAKTKQNIGEFVEAAIKYKIKADKIQVVRKSLNIKK